MLDWSPRRLVESFEPDARARESLLAATISHPDWLALDRGALDEREAIRRFAERAARSEAELLRFMDAVRAFLQPVPEVVALLESLAQRGTPLYCLSNMQAAVAEHILREHRFWSLFRGIVMSAHVGLLKPERAIFELLLARHGLDAASTAFVDDMPENVAAARELGLHGVLFRSAAQCRAELDDWLRKASPGPGTGPGPALQMGTVPGS